MKIIATLTHPDSKTESLSINEIAPRGNILLINDKSYLVCRTLFTELFYENQYDFEQVITNYPRDVLNPLDKFKVYLLKGIIHFENEEKDFLFKDVYISYYDENRNKNIEKTKLPYYYMRQYDCIKNGDSTYMCNTIKLSEKSEIFINLTNKNPIEDFRTDKNHFCRSI